MLCPGPCGAADRNGSSSADRFVTLWTIFRYAMAEPLAVNATGEWS